MRIHTLLKRGFSHKDFCEDFLLCKALDEKYLLAGVFDGCSSGVDSHFASVLFAKIVKNVATELSTNFTDDTEMLLKVVLFHTITTVDKIQRQLNLLTTELLTTIQLLLINKQSYSGKLICIGDGYALINGTHYNFDQNNQPDYLAYHLNELVEKEIFYEWFENHNQLIDIDKVEDISIASDGILSFLPANDSREDGIEPVHYLLTDTFLIKNSSMLKRKCNILSNKYKFNNFDDLSIVRIIKR